MILKKIKLWFFTRSERMLIQEKVFESAITTTKITLVQCPQQELFFKTFLKIITNNNKKTYYGINPQLNYSPFFYKVFIFPSLLKTIHLKFIRRKWIKIYKSIGIKKFYYSGDLFLFKKISNFYKALKIYKKIEFKKDVLQIEYKKIKCGDLIYDSYLRFNKKPTVNLNDLSLLFYIADCINQIDYFLEICKKNSIDEYYTSYTTYISHGIPVRVFLENKIDVYSFAHVNEINYNFQVKKLNKFDHLQTKPHLSYRKIFKKLNDRNQLIKLGLDKFKLRFEGKNDLDFMKNNQYDKGYITPKFDYDLDGVVFIGDFFDSQHIFKSMVFEDLYEWLIHTINLTLKFNLKIGFKPHPNQLRGSSIILEEIQKKHPRIKWINPLTSNSEIFRSGIKFGISVYGSVLPELAFHKIKPISCGDNPASSYNFIFQASSIKQYDDYILNHVKLNFKSNLMEEIGEFYYMNWIYKGYVAQKYNYF